MFFFYSRVCMFFDVVLGGKKRGRLMRFTKALVNLLYKSSVQKCVISTDLAFTPAVYYVFCNIVLLDVSWASIITITWC